MTSYDEMQVDPGEEASRFRAEDAASPHDPRLTAFEAGRWYALHGRTFRRVPPLTAGAGTLNRWARSPARPSS